MLLLHRPFFIGSLQISEINSIVDFSFFHDIEKKSHYFNNNIIFIIFFSYFYKDNILIFSNAYFLKNNTYIYNLFFYPHEYSRYLK